MPASQAIISLINPQNIKQLPGPKGWPILGNLLQLDLKKFHLILEQWANEFGTLYQITLGREKVLILSDPQLINEVLRKRPDTYRRRSSLEKILNEIGVDGVFTAEQIPLFPIGISLNYLRIVA